MGFPVPAGPIQYPAGYDRPVASAARWLLMSIESTYTEAGIELPTRRLVTIGSVAVDDPLVAVMYGGISVGPPGNELNRPFRGDTDPRSMTFNVELWRRTPTLSPAGNAPSAQSISDSSEIIMHDSWLLLEAAFKSDQTGVGIIASVAVNEPQGELHGVSMAVEMQVA